MNETEQRREAIWKRPASDYLGALSVSAGVLAGLIALDIPIASMLGANYSEQVKTSVALGLASASGIVTSAVLDKRGK